MFLAQYKVLRANGHSPSEAFNETVEEATQSLFPLIGQKGMDYMYNACSTTARRGALDWAPIFEAANRPVFEKLYESVKNGTETKNSLEFNGRKTYREDLAKELKAIDELKDKQKKGERLEATQLKKIDTEAEIRKELAGLGITS